MGGGTPDRVGMGGADAELSSRGGIEGGGLVEETRSSSLRGGIDGGGLVDGARSSSVRGGMGGGR